MDIEPPGTENPISEPSPQNKTDLVVITLRRSTLFAILLPVIFLFGLAAGYFVRDLPFLQKATPEPQAAAQPAQGAQQAEQEQQIRRYDVPVDDDPSTGPDSAAITIIEFSDFECPYCRKWHAEAWPQIVAEFGDQVRLVYRDFPLDSIHSNAVSSAEAANCAGDQGKYWEYHGLLFNGGETLGQKAYEKYAADLSLDQTKFNECLSSRKYQAEVKADQDYAINLGIQSTPTFFINGIPLVGAQPFAVFQEVITKELAGEYPK